MIAHIVLCSVADLPFILQNGQFLNPSLRQWPETLNSSPINHPRQVPSQSFADYPSDPSIDLEPRNLPHPHTNSVPTVSSFICAVRWVTWPRLLPRLVSVLIS